MIDYLYQIELLLSYILEHFNESLHRTGTGASPLHTLLAFERAIASCTLLWLKSYLPPRKEGASIVCFRTRSKGRSDNG